MTQIGDYYNESYAPISDDYLAAQARDKLKNTNSTYMRMNETTINPKSSRQSRYDEDNYALPECDSESSERSYRENTVNSSRPKETTEKNKVLTWKFALIGLAVLVLFSVAGGLAYTLTKSKGNGSTEIFYLYLKVI